MNGFKAFILRGNLVELAVAVIVGTAFAKVVGAFTEMLMGFIGKLGGQPDFSKVTVADVVVGDFINAVIAFVILAAIVYFLVVVPYTHLRERFFPQEQVTGDPADIALLKEIRDALRAERTG